MLNRLRYIFGFELFRFKKFITQYKWWDLKYLKSRVIYLNLYSTKYCIIMLEH